MPVMVTHNICMSLGLANGAVGRVVAFPEPRFSLVEVTGDNGERFLVHMAASLPPFVLVELERAPSARFSDELPPRVVPILLKADGLSCKIGDFKHSFTLLQFPLVPYFASTFHKAQGLSCDALCVWEVPMAGDTLMLYVGLSRVRTLAGLFLRQPITPGAVGRAAPSIELLEEIRRLDQLQAPELRTDPDVLARQISALAKKPKAARSASESAAGAAKKARRNQNARK